jgi:signal transduction histidine kinase
MAPRPRTRTLFFWGLFALAAVATGLAVHRLYQTAQQEISAQSERALLQERTRVLNRVQTYTEEVRHSTIAELASFHVDGLSHALRQWDETNEIILGTFQWDPAHGFPAGFETPPGGPTRDELVRLWQEFRAWRTQPSTTINGDPVKSGTWETRGYPTVDNPLFPVSDLGYQSENLDILTHAGHRADAWAGWAARTASPDAPWIFWYQAGPDEAVRGCFVDVRPIMGRLRSEITDTAYAQLAFVVASDPTPAAIALPGLPAYRLSADHGDIFHQKESRTRFTALITALLFGLFLVGAAALTVYTRRESRDAERKITFVTQVSHELRTPLTSIRMFADMLGEPNLPEAKRLKFAGTISTESGRLSALIERLLAFNALEKNGKKTTCVPLDVTALIRETVDEMTATLHTAGLNPELNLPDVPVFALSDHSTLKQALLNLLDNAIKYAREGKTVQLTLTSTADSVLLRVTDHGPGVPQAIRDQVFEPFVQGGQTLTNKAPGVGLGLSIARGMLRQAGADLVLLDTDFGTTFEIRLPVADQTKLNRE